MIGVTLFGGDITAIVLDVIEELLSNRFRVAGVNRHLRLILVDEAEAAILTLSRPTVSTEVLSSDE